MKPIISLLLSSSFFMTTSLYAAGPTNIHLQAFEDLRLSLALQLDDQGSWLQSISDHDGFEVAKRMMVAKIERNFKETKERLIQEVSFISEVNTQNILEMLRSNVDPNAMDTEMTTLILNDSSLGASDKVLKVMTVHLDRRMGQFKNKLMAEIGKLGFQKTFSDLANSLRSRNYHDSEWVEVLKGTVFAVLLFVGVSGFIGSIMESSVLGIVLSLSLIAILYDSSNAGWWS